MGVSIREYARHRGVAESTVRKASGRTHGARLPLPGAGLALEPASRRDPSSTTKPRTGVWLVG